MSLHPRTDHEENYRTDEDMTHEGPKPILLCVKEASIGCQRTMSAEELDRIESPVTVVVICMPEDEQ
jgi:hypothetical protein